MNIRIKRLRPHAELPQYHSSGAAAFDLAAAEDVTVQPGEVALVPTGLVVEVPAGMFLAIFARSSTPLKRGLIVANGVGVVDPDYSGGRSEGSGAELPQHRCRARARRSNRTGHHSSRPARDVGRDR